MDDSKKKKSSNGNEMYAPKNDPLGSYTGNPVDGGSPVQDADDL